MASLVVYHARDGEHWARYLCSQVEASLPAHCGSLRSMSLEQALSVYHPVGGRGWFQYQGPTLLIVTPEAEDYLYKQSPSCKLVDGVPEHGFLLLCGVEEQSLKDVGMKPSLPQTACNVRTITGEPDDTEQLVKQLADFISAQLQKASKPDLNPKCAPDGSKTPVCDKTSGATKAGRVKQPRNASGCDYKLCPSKIICREKTEMTVLLKQRLNDGDTLQAEVRTPKGHTSSPHCRKIHSFAFQFTYQGQYSGKHEVHVSKNQQSLGQVTFDARDPQKPILQVTQVYISLLQQLIQTSRIPADKIDAAFANVLLGHGNIPMATMRPLFAGCHIGIQDHANPTLLHLAAQLGFQESVAALIDIHDARLACQTQNSDGQTPADLARLSGRDDIAMLLEEFLCTSLQEEGLYQAMEECYAESRDTEDLDTYSTYADMRKKNWQHASPDDDCLVVGSVIQSPKDDTYIDIETTQREVAALNLQLPDDEEYGDSMTLAFAIGSGGGSQQASYDELESVYMPMQGQQSPQSDGLEPREGMEEAVSHSLDEYEEDEDIYLNEGEPDFKQTPEPFHELFAYEGTKENHGVQKSNTLDGLKTSSSGASGKGPYGRKSSSVSVNSSTSVGSAASEVSLQSDDSMWGSSQRELLQIMNMVKNQEISIDQAEDRFKSWQTDHRAGKSGSFKEKQAHIQQLQQEYKEAQERLKGERKQSFMQKILRPGKKQRHQKTKKSDVPTVKPESIHYRKSVKDGAVGEVASEEPPDKSHPKPRAAPPLRETKRFSTVSSSSSGSGSSYMSTGSAVSYQDSGIESQTYDDVSVRNHVAVDGVTSPVLQEEEEEGDKSGTLKAEDSSTPNRSLAAVINRPLPPPPTSTHEESPELPPRNADMPPALPPRPPDMNMKHRRSITAGPRSTPQSSPRPGIPTPPRSLPTLGPQPATRTKSATSHPTPKPSPRPGRSDSAPEVMSEAAATPAVMQPHDEEQDTSIIRKNSQGVNAPDPPLRTSSKLTEPLEQRLAATLPHTTEVTKPRNTRPPVAPKPNVGETPSSGSKSNNYHKGMMGDLSNSPLFQKNRELESTSDGSSC